MLAAEVGNWSAVAAGFDPGTPAAVVSAGRITAVTSAAAAAGIRPGMRRRQAQTECPVLELAEHDPDLDARCFAPVVAALEDLTPRVEVLAPGCCVVATRGPSRYYGGDEALAELAHRTVTEVLATGAYDPASSVSVGIADGLFAAGMAGRAALARTPSTPVLVVPPGSSAEFLGGLPLGTLAEECSLLTGCAADGTTDDLLSMLWQLGLRTLGDLAALPVGDLVGRFGTQGEWMHALASGRDPRLSQPAAAHPDLSVETEIDPPADRLDTVAFAAKSLADQLDAQLAREGQALVCVEVSAETEHGETCSGRWRHGFRFSPPDLVDRVRWQLDGWRSAKGKNSPTGGVSFIRLRAVETLPDEGRQLGFWGGQSEADERAERALQRVQTLVGFDGVTVGRLGSGRRFADLEQRLPFGTAGPLGTGASSTAGPLGSTGQRAPGRVAPGRWAQEPHHGMGRAVAVGRALVGSRRASSPSPAPSGARRRHRPSLRCRARSLAARGHLRLSLSCHWWTSATARSAG
ncbi:DNA polymerase Y family protein [Candidatus Poriferisodalis multihospitum]|uniref:DNA polymerase Y family protein n=1 Tax=Candidatus Poriferisodalis multihospitum TaxID=2983191 RepID=UPI002B2615F7|nr:DNA polymerase Y family protein [Candidatus Poriferisodalis multihospitum]